MDEGPTAHGTRGAGLGLLVAAEAAAVAVLLAVTPPTAVAARAPDADVSALLAALALAGGWLLVARLGLLAAAAVVALLPGAVGRGAAVVAVRLAPCLLRQAVVVAVGAATVLPAAAAPALAAPPPPDLPRLDRVVSWLTPPAAVQRHPGRPAAAVPPRPTPDPDAGSAEVTVVASGDTLWAIAAAHLPSGHSAAEVARAWPRWYARNRAVIGPDPGLLRPGERLAPPAGAEP
jgi:hypothetical protein